MPLTEKHFDRQLNCIDSFKFHFKNPTIVSLVTFLSELLAVALMKPRHLELRTLETHGTIELHEAQSGPHIKGIR